MSTISPDITVGTSGAVPTPPATIQANLLAFIQTQNPEYTNLPASLLEDFLSTAVPGIGLFDQAAVDVINSLTPLSGNIYLLTQLGNIYGVPQGAAVNTSVNVMFSGTPGYLIPAGFLISDGSYQYATQDAAVIASGGTTALVYALATQSGTWAVAEGSVTTLVSSAPSAVGLSVTNPADGTPASAPQTEAQFRNAVLQAGLATMQGAPSAIKAALNNPAFAPGVQSRLIAVQQVSGGYKIIVGGGDPYQVAAAIYTSIGDPTILVGSATTDRNNTVTISDYPDFYSILYVEPPQQLVSVSLIWNTESTNAVAASAVSALGIPAIVNYINGITVGAPINLFQLQKAFQLAVASLVPDVSRMVFTIAINGSSVSPESGTGIIAGDSESYFQTFNANVMISQG